MEMNYQWNRLAYTLWAPIYDLVLERFFVQGRKRAMELLGLRAGERLCLVGIGTGSDLLIGDAQALPLQDDAFDAVILNLVLSVVPDPSRCMEEAIRVLRPRGRIVVFDKFSADDSRAARGRRIANAFSTLLGTDINRRLGDIISGLPCEIVHDEPSIFGGMYRVVLLRPTLS